MRGPMEADRPKSHPVGPARKLSNLPVINRHHHCAGPYEEEIPQPDTVLASGHLKRLHLIGPYLAHDGVIDHNGVVIPKAHERRAWLVNLDHCIVGHPSMMHESAHPEYPRCAVHGQ
jgi:hypothetical protein